MSTICSYYFIEVNSSSEKHSDFVFLVRLYVDMYNRLYHELMAEAV